MKLLTLILSLLPCIIPAGRTFVEQITPRDSILIADQLRYGLVIKDFKPENGLALPDFAAISNDTLTVLGGWQLDTLVDNKPWKAPKRGKHKLPKSIDLKASITLAPFEAGQYHLPDVPVIVSTRDGLDSLVFAGCEMTVTSIPVDTTSFVPHDIKAPLRYPVTLSEVAPWVLGGLAAVALIAFVSFLIIRLMRRRKGADEHSDPPHIVALRSLEKYRSDKYWQAEKQKAFYSGVTDALKLYVDARFGIDAPEMTTAELFDALSAEKDIEPQMLTSLKGLFETADFVKFARHTLEPQANAGVIPLAVSFVTDSYQKQLESQEAGEEAHKED